jgi:TolA-binding protein
MSSAKSVNFGSIIVDGVDSTKYKLPAFQETEHLDNLEDVLKEIGEFSETAGKQIKQMNRRLKKMKTTLEDQRKRLDREKEDNKHWAQSLFQLFPQNSRNPQYEHQQSRISDRLAVDRRHETQQRLTRKRKHPEEENLGPDLASAMREGDLNWTRDLYEL